MPCERGRMIIMQEEKQRINLSNVDVRIGLGTILCLLIVHFCPTVQGLAACTAVIMCTQDNAKFSWKSELNRLLGVVIGGVCGTIVVLLNMVLTNDFVFILLCGLGVLLNLLTCQLAKMPNIVARVSCITFALVTLVLQGPARIQYALLRLLGTFVGATIALLLAWIWDKLSAKRES